MYIHRISSSATGAILDRYRIITACIIMYRYDRLYCV